MEYEGDQCFGVINEPTGPHTHTVIMLHGLYGSGRNFVRNFPSYSDGSNLPQLVKKLVKGVGGANADGIKYIFPTSPKIDLFYDGPDKPPTQDKPGQKERGWYTYYTNFDGQPFSDDDVINRDQFYASVCQSW
eukprot:scaffold67237_cov66-Phaeocystis_antarctica.AAC.5